jgi:hypothetical protein
MQKNEDGEWVEVEVVEEEPPFLGFLTITKGNIKDVKVINPTEVDLGYNTVYIVTDSPVTERIYPSSSEDGSTFIGITLENVRNKKILLTQAQEFFNKTSIIPDTLYSDSETLTWVEDGRTVMYGFNGATIVHPSGKISKCVNINGVKSMVTIYTPPAE